MILVTGASGLVGSHLIATLVNDGQKVAALYRTTVPSIQFADKVKWIKADILDVSALDEAFNEIDYVYHCAAIVSFHPNEKELLHQTNVAGTANVVNACIENNIKKLLFVSSVAALGKVENGIAVNETMQWEESNNKSEYGRTKYLAEMEVWRGIGEGLDAVIVNPVIILGAGNWHSGSSGIFKTAYKEFPWYTNGITGFVDVLDVVKAMVLLMQSNVSAERFILSAENMSYFTLFSTIAQGFGKKPPTKKVSKLMAQIVWRVEAFKAFFTKKKPLLTKETARTAQAKVLFDNSKLLKTFPNFSYTPIASTIERVCKELSILHNL